MTTRLAAIGDEVNRTLSGLPWHGISVAEVLADVTAEEAAARPIPGAHSIWELVIHLSGWAHEAEHRLKGGEPGEPDPGDWPAVTDTSEEAWDRSRADLLSAHKAALTALNSFPEDRLSEVVDREPDKSAGIDFELTVRGLATHLAWHGGQIALLKRAVRG